MAAVSLAVSRSFRHGKRARARAGELQEMRKTALNAFERFLKKQNLTMLDIGDHVRAKPTAMITILDQFGVLLAFECGTNGKCLSRNTVASYFGNDKNFFLDKFPEQATVCVSRLQKLASTLAKYCARKGDGALVKKAPACTKRDLESLTKILYSTATTTRDYASAALLSLMWYFVWPKFRCDIAEKIPGFYIPGCALCLFCLLWMCYDLTAKQ